MTTARWGGWLVIVAVLVAAVGRVWAQCDRWEAVAGLPGTNGVINATLVRAGANGPELIMGGSFTVAGSVEAFNVARWDGRAWSAIGRRAWVGGVYALAEYRGELYAAGYFTSADGQSASNVAKFDGERWVAMGTGVDQGATSLAVFQDKLLVGGEMMRAGEVSVSKVASWDGARWEAVSADIPSTSTVNAMLAGGDGLFIGTTDSLNPWGRVVSWNGTTATRLGPWPGNQVYSLAQVGNELWVGSVGNGRGGANVFRWDGTRWLGVGAAGPQWNTSVRVLSILESGGQTYVGGSHADVFGGSGPFLNRWNGRSWEAVGVGLSVALFSGVSAMATFQNELIVAGTFSRIGPLAGNSVFAYADGRSRFLGDGFNGSVSVMYSSENALYVGGDFSCAPGGAANGVVAYDGRAWTALGGGLTNGLGAGPVRGLTMFCGHLIAGGSFIRADGRPAGGIAEWDGQTWTPVGGGVPSGQAAEALCVFNDRLIVGGSSQVLSWDGQVWTLMPGSIGYTVEFLVHEGVLYRVGQDGSGMVTPQRWDGSAWQTVGRTLSANLQSLGVWDGRVVAGGYLSLASEPWAGGAALWNGSDWTRLGRGIMTIPNTLVTYRGDLIGGGELGGGQGEATNAVVRWDGSRWKNVGRFGTLVGQNFGIAYASAVFRGDLYVGGSFQRAEDLLSPYLARLTRGGCVGDMDDGRGNGLCDGGVTIEDLLYYLERYAVSGARADVDDGSGMGVPDGGVTVEDLLYYLGRYAVGC